MGLASFFLLELIAYASYKDHEWPFSCHKDVRWILRTSLGIEEGSFDVWRQFSSIEALYVGCEHGYTGVLAKVCTKCLPQGIELHTNEYIVDISIDKYSDFCDKVRKHTLL